MCPIGAAGGLSTSIHAEVDVLANQLVIDLTAGQACELDGADVLLPHNKASTVLADNTFDAVARVLARCASRQVDRYPAARARLQT